MTSAVEWTQIAIEFWIQRMRKLLLLYFWIQITFSALGEFGLRFGCQRPHIPMMSYLWRISKFWIENWMLFFGQHTYIMPMGWCVECTSHAHLAHSTISINAESLIRFRNFWFDWKIKDKLKFCALLIQFSINFWLERILREIP